MPTRPKYHKKSGAPAIVIGRVTILWTRKPAHTAAPTALRYVRPGQVPAEAGPAKIRHSIFFGGGKRSGGRPESFPRSHQGAPVARVPRPWVSYSGRGARVVAAEGKASVRASIELLRHFVFEG